MTRPAPTPTPHPAKLALLTVPLMISLVLQAISLLTLPFMGSDLNATLAEYGKLTGKAFPPLSPDMIRTVMWLSFFLTAALILWLYNTRRAVLEGRRWGRISTIVIAVLSLLLFPVGTVLGVVMLIGAFDREVSEYTSK